MTQGERYVWTAAYVSRLSEVNEGYFTYVLSTSSKRDADRALRQLSVKAVEFADMAVRSMGIARKELVKQKRKVSLEYERLVEVMKGRF